ncbi:MAG: glycoside hydrolase family 76 protein, partial [bacterium]
MLGALVGLLLMQNIDARLVAAETRLRETISVHFSAPDGYHMREVADKPEVAFLWSQGVLMGAVAQGLKVDKKRYQPLWSRARKALDTYEAKDALGGYAVLPGQKEPDRYYDDNAWIAWACLEAYDVTQDKGDLDRALKAYRFSLTGKDQKLDGGIYWHEATKTEKNACVNTPVAAVSLLLARMYPKDEKFGLTGDDLIAWTKKKLLDKDGLVQDNINLDGKVEPTKWSYNTACLIRAITLKYREDPAEEYKAQAMDFLAKSEQRWIDPQTHLLKDPGPFGQHLVDAMFEASVVFSEPSLR